MAKKTSTCAGGAGLVPLIEQPGSPRPGRQDAASRLVFPDDGDSQGDPRAWAQWFLGQRQRTEGFFEPGSPQDAFESLLDAKCPPRNLRRLLLLLYVMPTVPALTRAKVRTMRRTLETATTAVRALGATAPAKLGLVHVLPQTAWELVDLRLQLAGFLNQVRGLGRLEGLGELVVRADLSALVHQTTGKWREPEVGCLVACLLGQPQEGAAKRQELWHWRNRPLIDQLRKRYKRPRRKRQPKSAE